MSMPRRDWQLRRRGVGGQAWTAALLLAATGPLSGCGATTLRLSAAPTIDTDGKPGFESMLSFGLGVPLDYHSRSHHYLQARGTFAAGIDGRTTKATVGGGGDLDYLYFGEPRLDVRFGLHGLYRNVEGESDDPKRYSFGGHFGAYPIVLTAESSFSVPQLVIGPELRAEYVWTDVPGRQRGLISLPLVIEGNLLGAGD